MKTNLNLKSFVLLLVLSVMAVTVSAQRQYKHPRIKVKASKIENKQAEVNKSAEASPVSSVILQEEHIASNEIANEEIALVSTDKKAENKAKVKFVFSETANVVKSMKHPFDFVSFSNKMKEHTRLLKVKDVQKTAMEKWLLIAIILYAAAVVFMILAIVGEYAVYSYGMWIAFWILFAFAITAATIVLVLGLVGVI